MKTLKQLLQESNQISRNKKRITEDGNKYTELFNQINWDNVGAEILKKFKIKTTLRFEQDTHKPKHVEMISDDIIKQCGIFQYAIGECYLTFFSNALMPDNNERDEIFWASINLRYPGNGMSIGTLWVKRSGEVIIRVDSPRRDSRHDFDF